MLTSIQIERYHSDGCLVLPGFKSVSEIDALRQRAQQIVDAFEPSGMRPRNALRRSPIARGDGPLVRPSPRRRTWSRGPQPPEGVSRSWERPGERLPGVFTTHDQARTANAEFLASGDGIHCFFEEEAFDANGELTRPKALAINKIGHAMHDLDPVFDRFSRGPALADLAAELGLRQAQLWQSMFIFKPPGIGGEVKWHQDATFLDTTPSSVIGLWFALEDATLDNGCLWVQPGGHRGPLRERFVREHIGEQATGITGITANGARFGDSMRMQVLDRTPWPDASNAVPLEVPAGTLVVLHGRLPHYSAPNRSARSRHAYTLHAAEASSVWSPANWLQRGPGLRLRGFE